MKIDLTKKFVDLDDKVLGAERECCVLLPAGGFARNAQGQHKTQMVPTPNEVTDLKTVCCISLLAQFEGDAADGAEKYKRFQAVQEFQKAKDSIELSAEQITMIKELISKSFTTLVMGQAFDMLEGK